MPELIILFTLIVTILWLIIGWRAMRAHENISYTLMRFVASQETEKLTEMREEKFTKTRLYRQFLREDPEREKISARARHQAFRDWCDAEDES